jgi:uncharacterized damage-inducible protein DinB
MTLLRDLPREGSEKELLTAFLDYVRETVLRKIDGVGDEDLRRPMVASGTNLLGMVKHLGWVEMGWFQRTFSNKEYAVPFSDEDPDADMRVEPGESTKDVIDFYKQACEESRRVASAASLDDHAARPDRSDYTLRWIMLHMIEETSRHNGHIDILREMIDGATGE